MLRVNQTVHFEWPKLTRCCCCLPLRKGILAFGYINILFCSFLVGVYAYSIYADAPSEALVFHGAQTHHVTAELCLAVYCLEIFANAALIYGAHKKRLRCIRAFYYYGLASTAATVLMQLVDVAVAAHPYLDIELLALTFAGLCVQLYLLTLVRSLLLRLGRVMPQRQRAVPDDDQQLIDE